MTEGNMLWVLFRWPCVRDALLGSICVQSVDNARDNSPGDCGCSNSSSADESESIHECTVEYGH